LNREIFQAIEKRAVIVEKIQNQKKISWDPSREIKVFKNYIEQNPQNSLKQDLVYSLLIETQVEAFGYPRWSEGDHLKSNSAQSINQMLNPVLLRMRNESEYQALELVEDYRILLDNVWENQKLLQ
tara:strand:- start:74 stop:451 length:378 start_codon:yes stop_codon:yes gene_type:complete